MKKQKGFSAWLITWEKDCDEAKPGRNVVEILKPGLSPTRVREIVELLYHREALLSEKISWRLLKQEQPYKAEFPRIHGAVWSGEITCGHNPWLFARVVDNLVITKVGGHEEASWNNRLTLREATEKINHIHGKIDSS